MKTVVPRLRAERRRGATGAVLRWLVPVLVLSLLPYLPSLGHFFLLDDFWQLSHAASVHGVGVVKPWEYSGQDVRSYWFASAAVNHLDQPGFFRPLVTVLYWTDLKVWGPWAAPLHAMSLLLHLLATAGVFWIGLRLVKEVWAAALGAAVFGLHPGHYEAVAWVAANADALMGAFSILSIAMYVEHRQGGRGGKRSAWFYGGSVVAMLLALGSKEMAAMVPMVLVGYELTVQRGGVRGRIARAAGQWRGLALFFGIVLVYGVWRLPSASGVYRLNEGGGYMASLSDPLTGPRAVLNFAYFVLHLVLPYPVMPVNFAEQLGSGCWWAAGAAVGLMVAGFWWAVRLARPRGAAAGFGLGWLAVTLGPFCTLTPAQRLVYFPSAGFAIAVAAVAMGVAGRMRESERRTTGARAAVVGALVVYGVLATGYTAGLGHAAGIVRKITADLDRKIARLPAGTEVDLVNLWQPAWMMEHYIAVKYPGKRFDVRILSFDPKIVTPEFDTAGDALSRPFARWFPEEAGRTEWEARWTDERTLRIELRNAEFFRGTVEEELPVASEARRGEWIDAGPFVARGERNAAGAITTLVIRWKQPASEAPRVVLAWRGGGWKRVEGYAKAAQKKALR